MSYYFRENKNILRIALAQINTTVGDIRGNMAENLHVPLITIPINRIFSAYMESLKESFGRGEPGIEYENILARIRGNILMALSNRFGWLVLTTVNKTEIAVGYCTLYGDMAGGFAVTNFPCVNQGSIRFPGYCNAPSYFEGCCG